MSRFATAARSVGLALLCSSCSTAISSGSGETTVNGEAWYIRRLTVIGLPVAADVYYCPPPGGRGPATCKEAKIHGAGSFVEGAAGSTLEKATEEAEEGSEDDNEEEPAPKKKKKKKKIKVEEKEDEQEEE